MEEQGFITSNQDIKEVQIADTQEDQLLRVYVYTLANAERVGGIITAPQAISTVAIKNVTLISSESTKSLKQDENGLSYFEFLAEESISGELRKVSRLDMDEYKFVNKSSFQGITNDLIINSDEAPQLYTIRDPFNLEAYMKGDQAVYFGDYDPNLIIDKQDLSDIVDVEKYLLGENRLLSLTLTDTHQWEKESSNSKIIFVEGGADLSNPMVDVKFGKYIFTKDSSVYGLDINTNPRPDFKGQDGKLILQYVEATTGKREGLYFWYGNSPIVVKGEWIESLLVDVSVDGFSDFVSVLKDSKSTTAQIRESFYSNILYKLPQIGVDNNVDGLYERLFGINIRGGHLDEFVSRTFLIKITGKPDISITTGATYTRVGHWSGDLAQIRIIDEDEIASFKNNIYTETKTLPGLKIQTQSSAFLSSITAKAYTDVGKTDLDFKIEGNLMPLMVRAIDTTDKVTIDIPWFDTEVVSPYFFVSSFFNNSQGNTLDGLLPEEEDRQLVYDMLCITKLYQDKLKQLPLMITENKGGDEGKIKADTTVGWNAAVKANMLIGQTAIQINDGLFKAWQEAHFLYNNQDRLLRMQCALALLGRYIAVSKAVSGGATSFGEKFLPYYLTPVDGFLVTYRWTDNTVSQKEDKTNYLLATADPLSPEKFKSPLNIRWNINSKHFDIDPTSKTFTYKPRPDISLMRFIKSEGKYKLPVLPTQLSAQKINLVPSQIKPTDSDSLSYILYLPVKNVTALKKILLDSDKLFTESEDDVEKTFDLDGDFFEQQSQETRKKMIEDYVYDKYGARPEDIKSIDYGVETTIPFQDRVDRAAARDNQIKEYPDWITDATGFIQGWDYAVSSGTAAGLHGFKVLPKPIWREWSGTTTGDKTCPLNDDEMRKITHNLYPQFPADKIILDKTQAKYDIYWNYNLYETSYRGWLFNWAFSVTKFSYRGIKVVLKAGTYSESSIKDRRITFDKTQWNDFIRALNTSNNEIFDGIKTTYTIYTDRPINYISEINLRLLFTNDFTLIINGISFTIPSLNKDDETITYQKILIQ